MKATVRNDYGYLRVRAAPSTDASIIGVVQGGLTVEVQNVANNWAMVALLAGGATAMLEGTDQSAVGYMYAPMLDFGSTTLPDTSVTFELGVHSLTNGRAVDEANYGCKYVMMMNNLVAASQVKIAHPDTIVMVRYYFGSNVPTVDTAIAALGGAKNPGLVYTGLNESDALGQDGDALRQRAAFDIAMAKAIKQISGATYAAGTFSMGCPDFTSQTTCDIIRELYAPYYNNGLMKFDMHLYSPTMLHIYDDSALIWYERRWEYLFTKCGFDPTVKGIYCSETGVDEGGRGGFAGHSANQADFNRWCQRFIDVQKKALVINGASYNSPVMGGALFQLGGNGDSRWDAYDISGYVSTLRTLY
jgi:hypothetical protein